MRKQYPILIIALFLISFVCALPQYQNKYVNDFANVLDSAQSSELMSTFQQVEQNSTAEVVFVSVLNCSPLTPQEYALQLFDQWGVGKKSNDNGLIILYCKEENKIFAGTGYGLEGILPDSKIGRYLDDYYVPLRDKGNVSEGIVAFSEQISQVIMDNSNEVTSQSSSNTIPIQVIIIGLILFLALIIIIVSKVRKSINLKDKSKVNSKASSIPLLKETGKGIWSTIIFFIFFIIVFFSQNVFIMFGGIIIYFIVIGILFSRKKCPTCGERLKKYGSDDYYDFWKDKNGHKFKTLKYQQRGGVFIGGGGFGGGGFGGGGFGGGMSGGGGAGR